MAPELRTKGSRSSVQKQRQNRTQRISSVWKSQRRPTESRGLPTPQSWCYASSVLQAFLHAPKIVNWLERHSCEVEDCLACALRVLSLNYWKSPPDWGSIEIAHNDLRRTLERSPTFEKPGWDWSRQQDAAEFYLRLLDALKERGPEVIDELFDFAITNAKTCPNCGNEEGTMESNISLHVNFENGASLEDILRHITFGPSTYHVSGPDILVMHIARFTDWDGSTSGKNTDIIPFSEGLELSEYTHGNFALKYRLLSVVQHHGTRESGHYINIAKGRTGRWKRLDDETASNAIGTDPFCPRHKAAFTPYVLFWAKVEEDVSVNSSTTDKTVSTDDDEDDKLQPLQISINGVLQPPSGIYFVKKSSALAKLNQPQIEKVSADIGEALLESEAWEREMREKEKREKLENETKRAEEEKKGKRETRKDEEKHVSKPLKQIESKRIEKKRGDEMEKGRKKKETEIIQTKEDEKAKERKEKEKDRIQRKKEREKENEKKKKEKDKIQKQKEKEKEKQQNEQKKSVSNKRKRFDENSLPTHKMVTRSMAKKQKALEDEASNQKVGRKKPQADKMKPKK